MVLDRVDQHRVAADVCEDRGLVTVEVVSDGVVEQGLPVFGAVDQVDVESGEGLGHGSFPIVLAA